ncbi:glucose-6-phosphate isomerase [Actimicrobium sp. CCI2.3]|uniref:glucose-6-phosphate isomerase n=1 Tax=Actimicrobium sp. CCI2.3 TaxID=3048616 RepID=UPI002AB39AB1|nr:glucose-6-phosphate isomerase [Actimicrobium sp. CCI2.3]MDY7575609.1 glucose-6-phosphate isomerase [Actimicrobium sp. CCI2.3]MEB0022020.1 glucose-6-phosphate isomerase [Actimicrobium sp. CCI2.3]
MASTPLTDNPIFRRLQTRHAETCSTTMRAQFASEPNRFQQFSMQAAGLTLDYSKNRIDRVTLDLLLDLARERDVEGHRHKLFAGEKINTTEQRAVLHTALRAPAGQTFVLDGQDVDTDVQAVLTRMQVFSEQVRSGAWTGRDGRAITDIVNIGIGGSYLGPKMVCQALRTFAHPRLTCHFVSNVDGHDLAAVLARVEPATTLFIIASKTFATAETMMNARSARSWFLQGGSNSDLAKHFVAVSTNLAGVTDFGINPANMFPFWDWVGGRYSIWSAIGLSVAVLVGFPAFRAFLDGAHQMDKHFQEAPLERNMPVLLAMLGVWYRNFHGSSSVSIAPYHQDLSLFAGYLQQLDMESNGKHVSAAGEPLTTASGPVIWGDTGTNGQHAYFQLLHQGSDLIPIDFIAVLGASHTLPGHQAALLANCFAQAEAFMRGKTADEVRTDLAEQGLDAARVEALMPHKTFPGNRPSNMVLMEALTPATLGALVALYEHKVFVQGVIWGINSFDQWGVELGKVLAKSIAQELTGAAQPAQHDSSTNALIALAKAALEHQPIAPD